MKAEEKAKTPEEVLRQPKYSNLKSLVLICEAMEEYANQQPEGERECKYCGAMTTEPDEYCYRNPNSSEKQPEQGEVESVHDEKLMDLLWEVKEGKTHPNRAWKTILKMMQSTLTQDKGREAAEKVVMYYNEGFTRVGFTAKNVRFDSAIGKLEKALNQNK